MWIAWLGIVVNIVLLFCTLDIYLANHFVPNVDPVGKLSNPPAKRLLLFVSDGLRADMLWSVLACSKSRVAESVREEGCFGESVGYMPSMTRTGVVAITAGVRINPLLQRLFLQNDRVPSVFNNSEAFFYLGPKDVFDIVNLNTDKKRVTWSFIPHVIRRDKGCDDILYDKFTDLLRSVKNNEFLKKELHKDGAIFYFHLSLVERQLLGRHLNPVSDMGGALVSHQLRLVDKIVARFQKEFRDDKTAFVFCSDHGMTDRGTHGGGSIPEMTTPVVAWGAGVASSQTMKNINQIDLAPFLATLIGLDIPSNSIGRLPLEMLDLTPQQKTEAVIGNSKQTAALASAAATRVPRAWNELFELPNPNKTELLMAMKLKDYDSAFTEASKQLNYSQGQVTHNEAFYRNFVFCCHILILLMWGLLCLTALLPKLEVVFIQSIIWDTWISLVHTNLFNRLILRKLSARVQRRQRPVNANGPSGDEQLTGMVAPGISTDLSNEELASERSLVAVPSEHAKVVVTYVIRSYTLLIIDFLCIVLAGLAIYFVVKSELPWPYVLYLLLPIILVWGLACNVAAWVSFCRSAGRTVWFSVLKHGAIALATAEYLHWSLLFNAPISLPLCVIGLVPIVKRNRSSLAASGWHGGLAALAFLVPAARTPAIRGWVLYPGGAALVVATASAVWFMRAFAPDLLFAMILAMLQVVALVLQLAGDTLGGGKPSPVVACLGWVVLSLGMIAPAFVLFFKTMRRSSVHVRLFHIAAALSVPVLLLSSAYEPFACIAIYSVMAVWLYVEVPRDSERERGFGTEEVRRALLGYYFALFIFLSMGNSAWTTPFSLSWTRNLVSYSDEELALFLIVTKHICSIMVLATAMTAIVSRSGVKLASFIPMILFLLNLSIARMSRELAAVNHKSFTSDDIALKHQSQFIVLSKYCSLTMFAVVIIICFLVSKYVYRIDKIKV